MCVEHLFIHLNQGIIPELLVGQGIILGVSEHIDVRNTQFLIWQVYTNGCKVGGKGKLLVVCTISKNACHGNSEQWRSPKVGRMSKSFIVGNEMWDRLWETHPIWLHRHAYLQRTAGTNGLVVNIAKVCLKLSSKSPESPSDCYGKGVIFSLWTQVGGLFWYLVI